MELPSDYESTGFGLRRSLDVLRRRKWIVIALFVVAAAVAGALSAAQQDVYRAQTKIVIGQGNSLFQPQFGNQQQSFTATMSDLLQSNVVATNVIESLGLHESPEHLLGRLSVSINPETAVLKLNVDDHDPAEAKRIAQRTGVYFSQLVKERFGSTPTGTGADATAPLTATIFDPAHVLPGKVAPRTKRNVVVAAALGLVLGLIAAFLREHFDRVLRTREEVERAFGLPVIGQVPFEKQKRHDTRTVTRSGHGEVPEAYRALRANLQYLAVHRPLRTILVTSAAPEQGKTTVAANLALAIARSGASTVVIDGDLRRPRIEAAFGVGGGVGLTSVLVGAAQLPDVLVDVDLSSEADTTARLAVVPSGPLPPNPTELLSSPQMEELLDRIGASFDYLVIDSPPLLLVADALELARVVDGVVLCVRRMRATSDDARELRALVERLGVNLVGTVLTDVEPLGSYGSYGDTPPESAETHREPPREAVVTEEV
jgi:receptor protein-tyrosine kinase